ncbi:malto-oligosyltrehalose synthase [Roseospira marina]|uniref:Malto-oligosyltrehalose synthase n=1 Tax=Roseospira marina TaxID=140057 RepID=A0A5M6IGA5_9PROT|nr:malto-oligosyltrehalose synthase [Roseospira marina]KAA5607340.1 malto-oligosyltrehalose synthase [Roseospira marina]MBB4312497.1 (1->4)-alpha-D-glucan 1-alpha-D-glucosylmutase [Roseospira marina]MBB5085487.1 (1->4)-alpha-D-glucan 1-alpha-D-glucosylmutase [Roseospira marina]
MPPAVPSSAVGVNGPPTWPRATVRLQMTPDFGFDAATAIVPTLSALGISHVYLSPIMMARAGSQHGYDIIDHSRINPDLGGEPGFRRFSDAVQVHGMGLILDIVPNHMGIGVGENRWWRDVLEWGRDSPHADWFDIDWEPAEPSLHGKILLPVLGDHYGAILERGELTLRYDAELSGFVVRYYEHAFPIRTHDYGDILRQGVTPDRDEDGVLALVIAGADSLRLSDRHDSDTVGRRRVAAVIKRRLAELLESSAEARAAAAAAEAAFTGTPGQASSFDPLNALIERQNYRPAFWRVAAHEINYRRFFEINDLAALRMERTDLFETAHKLLFDLIAEGRVQGIRLDHVDGLLDPQVYFQRLQADACAAEARGRAAGHIPPVTAPNPADMEADASPFGPDQPFYVIVEKILAPHERLRESWPIAGSTGYEFMNQALGLFIDPAGEGPLNDAYAQAAGPIRPYEDDVLAAKRQVMEESLASEVGVMANRLNRLAKQSRATRDYSRMALRAALIDVIAHFPVYRTYVSPRALAAVGELEGDGADPTAARIDDQDRRDLQWAVGLARKRARTPDVSVYDFLYDVLTGDLALADRGHDADTVIDVAMRVQQLTSPVMAKAMEDTAFYRYVRLTALNEVGGEPERFGLSVTAFHHACQTRLEKWPFTLLATATHDHKRGEDMRVRLALLSEAPEVWLERVRRWRDLNQRRASELPDGRRAPSANDEYLFYQTLLGIWPLDLAIPDEDGTVAAPPSEALADITERMVAYMQKAAREAKRDTAWTAQDPEYEAGVEGFVRGVLSANVGGAFVADMAAFVARLAPAGIVNALAQTTLRLTVPGVPDLYQGTDLWDFSLVDPDNRRPVDFVARARWLAEGARPSERMETWRDGRVKQALIAALLDLRTSNPNLFAFGDYVPLETVGCHADRLIAFARVSTDGDQAVVVVVPRLVWPLMDERDGLPLPRGWADTAVQLPADAPWATRGLCDVLGRPTAPPLSAETDGTLPAALLLEELPVAVRVSDTLLA